MSDAETNEAEVILETKGICRSYFRGTEVPVLRGVDLEVRRGEMVAIVGASGCGKSTLLHVMGTLDVPDAGEVWWRGKKIDHRKRRACDRFRNESVGYVFQFYHLLPELNALENVMLPALIRESIFTYWTRRRGIRKRAEELMERVGLGHRMDHRPAHLSGGELQRAAIARSLLGDPELLLADEPTGNLDAETGEGIIQLLCELSRDENLSIVLVTHDAELAKRTDRVLRLVQGALIEEGADDVLPVAGHLDESPSSMAC
ncbi:P-loop containing nucleoside triphosphate hydrolase [Planctomycetes bacterium Pan216]|uniref:P-loop containing nucleoside triphosphate hydrolase n=1 Tax=Kolteria novifilia TaxID=2527975 RepID=A0A518B0R4_9BACT|nr:P-loop containing nucleoside triphosphate hydrolase [Planctomycetes bacterium Pan216]